MNFSAAALCKQSASQIFYLRKHKDKIIVTPEQLSGIKHQKTATKSKYREMCGNITIGKHTIYFSWDEVKIKSENNSTVILIEHKQVPSEHEDWYLENALLQTAIYAALTVKSKELTTAKFYKALGNKEYKIKWAGHSRRFYLYFGNTRYKIKLLKSRKLLFFLEQKLLASLSYDTAIAFDSIWKHKEFKTLKDCFAFNLALTTD